MQAQDFTDRFIQTVIAVAAVGSALYGFLIRPLIARVDRMEDGAKEESKANSDKRAALHAKIDALKDQVLDRMHNLEIKFTGKKSDDDC